MAQAKNKDGSISLPPSNVKLQISKKDQDFCVAAFSKGAKYRDLCEYLICSEKAFRNYRNENPDFAHRLKKSRQNVNEQVRGYLLEHCKESVAACQIWLRNNAGWSDKDPADGTKTIVLKFDPGVPPALAENVEDAEVVDDET